MKAFKCFLGKKLYLLFEKHKDRSLDVNNFPQNEWEQNWENYFHFGLNKYTFDIIYENAENCANNSNYTGCHTTRDVINMQHWYKYTQLYRRIFQEIPGNTIQKLIKIIN